MASSRFSSFAWPVARVKLGMESGANPLAVAVIV
jgi:hypothetical protein